MAATAAQIARLRRMVNEPTEDTYTNEALAEVIERYPLPDENGEEPRIPAIDSARPVVYTAYMDVTDKVDNEDWQPTYDIHAAAAEIWTEKASVVTNDFDFSADGGNYTRSQVFEQCMKMARHHNARRSPRSIETKPQPHKRLQGGIQ